MLLVALSAALLFQVPDPGPAPDTTGAIYDSPATRALVERAVEASGDLPPDLNDYQADVHTSMYITLAPQGAAGGDLPASVDELVSEVRWNEQSYLHQTVQGHRTRLLIPLPYTLASILEQPWVIPHLYGSSIYTPFLGPRAISPFGARGPEFYRYAAQDPVRIRVQGELVTLVPVEVRPRVEPRDDNLRLVLGTFYLDADRAAVARARYGFAGTGGDLPRTVGQVETFLELENGLWEGRYWLPFRQRREIVFNSKLLGGAVTARVINRFGSYRLNTGWSPGGERVRLVWAGRGESAAFAQWDGGVGEEAAEYSMEDFADLRLATATHRAGSDAPRLQLHYDQGQHLFRYNRVEGPFVGIGGRVIPADPRRDRWELYGTAGWAFAEGTPRGELSARWGMPAVPLPAAPTDRGVELTAYRRLQDLRAFRPTYDWDWIYTLPALFWGSDQRDYHDATGVELFASGRRGRWTARLGGRVEEHDSVSVNTEHFLFGVAEEFGPVVAAEPGTHAALEASAGYALGPGAFGVGNSAIARVETEVGVGDFGFQRVSGLLSTRYHLGLLTLAARADAGHTWGSAPPQKLFRFGSVEGLRGYEPNQFGGSSAVLARGRLLVGLPPRSTEPLARIDFLLIPPLRPSLVLLAETGWTRIGEGLEDELLRLGAAPTGGWRSAVGVGLSFLDDAVTIERLEPVGYGAEDQEGRWYIGLTTWY